MPLTSLEMLPCRGLGNDRPLALHQNSEKGARIGEMFGPLGTECRPSHTPRKIEARMGYAQALPLKRCHV